MGRGLIFIILRYVVNFLQNDFCQVCFKGSLTQTTGMAGNISSHKWLILLTIRNSYGEVVFCMNGMIWNKFRGLENA